MTDNQHTETKDQVDENQERIYLLDYITLLLKWRKFIIINFLVVSIAAAIISLLLPKWYKAKASILPPKEQGVLNPFGAAGSLIKSLTSQQKLGGLGQNMGVYNYIAILKSRSAMEAVINRFNLIDVYEISDRSIEEAIKQLIKNVSFEIQDEDYITIEVNDKEPKRAADMANYFVESLNNISIQLGTLEARNNREFIYKRLEKSREDLRAAEESLRHYQEKSGMMITPDQSTSSINAIAELYGMKARKEVEIAIMERTVTTDNKTLQQLKLELNELTRKLASVPQAGIESFRLYRDVVIQQKIVEFLVPIYEQAKIDEQKDVPVILVLDKAVPPEKKDKPKRMIIVALWALISIFFSVLYIFAKEGAHRLEVSGKTILFKRELEGSFLYKKFFRRT